MCHTHRFNHSLMYMLHILKGAWQFEGPTFPTIPELVDHQLKLGTAVTQKSQAFLKKPIPREEWELKNDDIDIKDKIGAVRYLIILSLLYFDLVYFVNFSSF